MTNWLGLVILKGAKILCKNKLTTSVQPTGKHVFNSDVIEIDMAIFNLDSKCTHSVVKSKSVQCLIFSCIKRKKFRFYGFYCLTRNLRTHMNLLLTIFYALGLIVSRQHRIL